jgi:hypothetical protein
MQNPLEHVDLLSSHLGVSKLFGIRDEEEVKKLHQRFFAFWEHRKLLEKRAKQSSSFSNLAPTRLSATNLRDQSLG